MTYSGSTSKIILRPMKLDFMNNWTNDEIIEKVMKNYWKYFLYAIKDILSKSWNGN